MIVQRVTMDVEFHPEEGEEAPVHWDWIDMVGADVKIVSVENPREVPDE